MKTLLVTTVAALVLAGMASATAWTPAQASAKMNGRCVGKDKPVAGKYKVFRCVVKSKVVWVKVPQPQLGTVDTSAVAVRWAISRRFQPDAKSMYPVSVPQCKRTSRTTFVCTVADVDHVQASATVLWPTGAVTFTRFTCSPELAAEVAKRGQTGC